MTEEEAQKLWCPMVPTVEVALAVGPTANNCIASKCAMWRWDISFMSGGQTIKPGYCGLAGK